MGWQQVWPRFLRCVWLHRLLDDGARFEVAKIMCHWNSQTMTSHTVPVANHVGQYDTEVFVFPKVIISFTRNSPPKKEWQVSHKNLTSLCPCLTPYVPKFQEYLKRVSLKRNPEPFTFCFAGRTPSRVAELRDREFAGTQWLGHVTLFAENLCNVYPSVYTETRNKNFHVMARFFSVIRVVSYASPTTRLIRHVKNSWNSTGMDVKLHRHGCWNQRIPMACLRRFQKITKISKSEMASR